MDSHNLLSSTQNVVNQNFLIEPTPVTWCQGCQEFVNSISHTQRDCAFTTHKKITKSRGFELWEKPSWNNWRQDSTITKTFENFSTNSQRRERQDDIKQKKLSLKIAEKHSDLNSFFKKNKTVIIEGNIAAGKTTLLQHIEENASAEILTLREPLELWKNIAGCNLLKNLYENPEKWSMSFELFVMKTCMENHLKECKIKIMERGLSSCLYVFMQAQRISNMINETNFNILKEWHNFLSKTHKINEETVIYIRTDPEIAFERMKKRNREEEKNIPKSYLELLHQLYDNWLLYKAFEQPKQIIILNGNLSTQEILRQLDQNILTM